MFPLKMTWGFSEEKFAFCEINFFGDIIKKNIKYKIEVEFSGRAVEKDCVKAGTYRYIHVLGGSFDLDTEETEGG